MHQNDCYRINQPAVISEVIDGEAIVVNLDSGAYYSMRDSACAAWELFAQQLPLSAVVAQMVSCYSGAPGAIEDGVKALLAELLQEQLLIEVEGAPNPAPPATVSAGDGRLPFAPPVLEKFTDMADLLLLDPIHEVDEAGWPHPAPGRIVNA